MSYLSSAIQHLLSTAIQRVYPDKALSPDVLSVVICRDLHRFSHHYQSDFALRTARAWDARSQEIAEQVIRALKQEPPALVDRVEMGGAGFINFTLNGVAIGNYLHQIMQDPRLGIPLPERRNIVVDFSCPNTAKEMHVGHLRSTIIGDTIARLFEFEGHNVSRINHVGDWGTQFGMLISYIKTYQAASLEHLSDVPLSQLVEWYKAAKIVFDTDESFKRTSRDEVVCLQSGEPGNRQIWLNICESSRRAYNDIYRRLDVSLQEMGESFYNPFLPDIIEQAQDQHLLEESDGARGVRLETGEFFMLQKSDGGFNYNTTDVAAARYRVSNMRANQIVYVTGVEQTEHLKAVFEVVRRLGFCPPEVELIHAPFGMVLGSDGKKFKTRAGDVVLLRTLLDEAEQKAEEKIDSYPLPRVSGEQRAAVIHSIGIGCLKYADLSSNRVHNYQYDAERMLSMEGQTAVYLLYSLIRAKSILARSEISANDLRRNPPQLRDPSELQLSIFCAEFPKAMKEMEEQLAPHHLANYLFALSSLFNHFYQECPVLSSEDRTLRGNEDPVRTSRLQLCSLFSQIMTLGLNILGIPVIEKM